MASYERITLDAVDFADGPATYNGPDSVLHPRPAFRRQSSSSALPPGNRNVSFRTPSPIASGEYGQTSKEGGLGISFVPSSPERIKRVPVGSKETLNSTYSTPELASDRTSQTTTYQNTPSGGTQSYVESPDTQMLQNHAGAAGGFDCPTHKDILDPKMTWLSITIILLAIYSTVFSAIYLIIAMLKPRWGQRIGTSGHVSLSTASLLSALFAKTIELSFVTVFVTFLGQALSRRAFRKSTTSGGMSIAEMTMRTWVMQPGTLITHWEAVRYSARTFLGGITLLAALAAIFYTTAAEALVAPKLKDGNMHITLLQGKVEASFANTVYLEKQCQTPIPRTNVDPDTEGTTCLEIDHAGQGWHNFKSYIDTWVDSTDVGNMSNTTTYATRPPPVAMLYDNTTVQGQWIMSENPSIPSAINKRIVQNLTMAMPHANVFNAVRDPVNGILQPQDLDGAGEYTITASVPAPATNILCVGMSEQELEPIVYTAWPNVTDPSSNNTLNVTSWPINYSGTKALLWSEGWQANPNKTAVDQLFGFSHNTSDPEAQFAPVFPKYPIDYNTVISFWQVYGQLAVYLLAKPPTGTNTDEYLMCSIRAFIYCGCSTLYHAEQSGGLMSVHCDDDPLNTIPYNQSQTAAPLMINSSDWKDVGSEWINSISLGQGISDGSAAGARMLTQMIPPYTQGQMKLQDDMPSTGEALSVLAGCTLLISSLAMPFVHYWNYAESSLTVPQYEPFNASVSSRDYASGGTQHWQGIFYVILAAVFIMNLLCLVYLLVYYRADGQVTDFTEPQNLFSLAINSPPSYTMSGTCGAGPEGAILAKRWKVGMQRDEALGTGYHPHFYVKFPDDEWSQAASVLSKRKKRSSVRRMEGFEMEESPAVEQYMRLSGKWSSIL